MKATKRKNFLVFVCGIIMFSILLLSSFPAYAHNAVLDITYDYCIEDFMNDGIDEMWYVLNYEQVVEHLDHEIDRCRHTGIRKWYTTILL